MAKPNEDLRTACDAALDAMPPSFQAVCIVCNGRDAELGMNTGGVQAQVRLLKLAKILIDRALQTLPQVQTDLRVHTHHVDIEPR